MKGSTSVSYIVDHPEAGNWTCIITANEVPPGGENVELSLYSVKMTPPQVNLEDFADKSILDDPVTVTASVNDSDGFKDFIFFLDGYAVKYIPVSVADKSSIGSVVIDPTQLEDGVHWISASASDANWTTGGKELKFIIDNYLPIADAGPDQVVKVGEKVLFNGSNSKDSAYSSWEFGDGTTQSGIYPYGIHTYSQPGSYTVRLTVYDDAGNQSTDEAMVTVTSIGNTPPNIGEITVAPTPATVNSIVNANVYFTDPDSGDAHTATWDWGDGMNSPGIVDEAGYQVTGSHQYTTPGVYTVLVTVSDSGSGTGEAFYQFVVIYDPEGGFVTGGGWVNSPAGAYTSDSTLTGKAVFGFNSKYQRGANIPTGQTEFQFKVADLNFHSTIYDWLVISGSKAQYKGTGTINGAGEYGFKLSAIDGDLKGGEPDKFRIKIWDKATGTVVYDNQLGADENAEPSTTIDGGSIVIHKE